MKKLLITTTSGQLYRIHENGNIERTDIEDFKPSGQWKVLRFDKWNGSKQFSLEEVFARAEENLFVEFASEARQNGEFILRNKNRTAKLFIRDNDHGSVRSWSDGIAKIQLIRD